MPYSSFSLSLSPAVVAAAVDKSDDDDSDDDDSNSDEDNNTGSSSSSSNERSTIARGMVNNDNRPQQEADVPLSSSLELSNMMVDSDIMNGDAAQEQQQQVVVESHNKRLSRPSSKSPLKKKKKQKRARIQWEQGYRLLVDFKEKHGHLRIPTVYTTAVNGNNIQLGKWIVGQRLRLKRKKRHLEETSTNGSNTSTCCSDDIVSTDDTIITRERIARLTAIDFPWTVPERHCPGSSITTF
jgi:Helicase associated domain